MVLRELPSAICRARRRPVRTPTPSISPICRRRKHDDAVSEQEVLKPTSVELEQDLQDLESDSPFLAAEPPPEIIKSFNPLEQAQSRKEELPPSRYQYRPPKYYRGPLHPHQPPPPSDPSSRVFVPGPFYHPRMQQTYQATIAPDLMSLLYKHKPPGTITAPKSERLRTWDDSSPYHSGRPKRGPRGPAGVLRFIEPDINWRNIPKIEAVTVHSFTKGAVKNSAYLHVGGMALQAITGAKPTVHRAKKGASAWGLRERMPISLTCHMRGDMAVEFLDKCIHLVLPKIKDWPGVRGTTGDSSGNLMFGFNTDAVVLFPEVQVNYDMYPPQMIPGFHVTIHTTAKSDRHARLLLKAMGLPFYGKLVN